MLNAEFSYIASSIHTINSAFTSYLGPVLEEDLSIGKQLYIANARLMQMPLYQHSFI